MMNMVLPDELVPELNYFNDEKKILKTTASDLLIEFGYEKDLNW